jgi:hypothetical protein
MKLVDKILLENVADDVTPKQLINHLKDKYGVKEEMRGDSYGLLWLANNNHIIKITTDPYEAKLAASLVGKDNPHYANIYSVHKYKVPGFWLYIIDKEYILNLTPEEKEEYYFVDARLWRIIFGDNGDGTRKTLEYATQLMLIKHPDHRDMIDKMYRLRKYCRDADLGDIRLQNIGKKPNGELAGFDFQLHAGQYEVPEYEV